MQASCTRGVATRARQTLILVCLQGFYHRHSMVPPMPKARLTFQAISLSAPKALRHAFRPVARGSMRENHQLVSTRSTSQVCHRLKNENAAACFRMLCLQRSLGCLFISETLAQDSARRSLAETLPSCVQADVQVFHRDADRPRTGSRRAVSNRDSALDKGAGGSLDIRATGLARHAPTLRAW